MCRIWSVMSGLLSTNGVLIIHEAWVAPVSTYKFKNMLMCAVEMRHLSYQCSPIEKLFHTDRLSDKTSWNITIFKPYHIEGYCGLHANIYLVAPLHA